MKGTVNNMPYQGTRSSAKSWLQGILNVLVALNVISLIAVIMLAIVSIVAGGIAIGAIHGLPKHKKAY